MEEEKLKKKKAKIRKIIIIIIIVIAVIIIAGKYPVDVGAAETNEGDESNVPYKTSEYMESISIDKEGKITNTIKIKDLWDGLVKNQSDIEKYLDSESELAKLIRAETATKYPDLRSADLIDSDKEEDQIKWDELDDDTIQGIVKFKRESDNGKAQTMEYVDSDTFYSWINDYNSSNSGDENLKNKILTHFTLKKVVKKNKSSSSGTGGTGETGGMGIKALGQYDSNWSNDTTYGDAFGNIGCGPTSVAMVVNYLKDTDYNPLDVAANMPGFSSAGASESGIESAASYYGVTYEKWTTDIDEIIEALENGHPVILHVQCPYPHTNHTHYTVAAGINDDGNFIMAEAAMGIIEDGQCNDHGVVYTPEFIASCLYAHGGLIFEAKSNTTSNNNDKKDKTSNKSNTSNTSNTSKSTSSENNSTYTTTNTFISVENCPNAFAVYEALVKNGLSEAAAAGILGTLFCECGGQGSHDLNPASYSDDGSSRGGGIAGFTDNSSTNEFSRLQAYASEKGTDWTDIDTQVEFLLQSMPPRFNAADYNTGSRQRLLERGFELYDTWDEFINADDVATATYTFLAQYADDLYDGTWQYYGVVNSMDEWVQFETGNRFNCAVAAYNQFAGKEAVNNTAKSSSSSSSSTYMVVVATWREVDTTYDYDSDYYGTIYNPETGTVETPQNTSQYTLTTKTIDYQAMTKKYTMPFDLLWTFLVLGEDKNLAFDLAELAYDSDIVITIYDNITTTTNVDNWTFTKYLKAYVHGEIIATAESDVDPVIVAADHQNHIDVNPKEQSLTKTVVTKTDSVSAVLTYADVWYVNYKNDYTYSASDSDTQSSQSSLEGTSYSDTPFASTGGDIVSNCEQLKSYRQTAISTLKERVGDSVKVTVKDQIYSELFDRYDNIVDNKTIDVHKSKYVKGEAIIKEKITEKTAPNFVTVFNSNENRLAKNRILDVDDWLFEIIENNNAADLEDLLKYLIFKATKMREYKDYRKFDFEEYLSSDFNSVSSDSSSNTSSTEVDGDFLKTAQNIWKKVCESFTTYGDGAQSNIPISSGQTYIDCSSYVSWVLYEYGYTEFAGTQKSTYDFMNTDWNAKYGWEEISVAAGENPYDQLQEGDIFVRRGEGENDTQHMNIIVKKENGKIYCYDCGVKRSGSGAHDYAKDANGYIPAWDGANGEPVERSFMLTDTVPGKIIRIKKNS